MHKLAGGRTVIALVALLAGATAHAQTMFATGVGQREIGVGACSLIAPGALLTQIDSCKVRWDAVGTIDLGTGTWQPGSVAAAVSIGTPYSASYEEVCMSGRANYGDRIETYGEECFPLLGEDDVPPIPPLPGLPEEGVHGTFIRNSTGQLGHALCSVYSPGALFTQVTKCEIRDYCTGSGDTVGEGVLTPGPAALALIPLSFDFGSCADEVCVAGFANDGNTIKHFSEQCFPAD